MPQNMRRKTAPDKRMENNRRSGGADSILHTIFKDILFRIGGTNESVNMVFNRLMDRFLSDARNGIPQNTKDRSSARGNLRKELEKPNMSWKVFCKGLRFFGAVKFDITITMYDANRKKMNHSLTVDLGEPIYTDQTFITAGSHGIQVCDWTNVNNKDILNDNKSE